MTIERATEFVLKHRKGNAFIDWSKEDISRSIKIAVKRNLFASVEKDGVLLGLVTAYQPSADKIIYIENILTIHRDAIKELVQYFQDKFPGYQLMARRNKQFVLYKNTNRLCHLLKHNSF